MKKQFKWERWVDPLKPQDFKHPSEYEPDDDENDFEEGCSFKALPTPFGMLSITHHALASNKFEFWMLHTNFKITHIIAHVMKEVPGVETMNVLTRYRIRFGFPKSGLFDIDIIKNDIETAILQIFRTEQNESLTCFDSDTFKKATEIRDYLDDCNDHWILYILPNGHMDVVTHDDYYSGDEFEDKMELFQVVQSLVGGKILTSEDES